jgi:hypothetical protein
MATAVLEPPSIAPPDNDKGYGGGGDDDQCLLHCVKCEFIYFAPRAEFNLIERRQGMCKDCFRNYLLDWWGLDPKWFPRTQTEINYKL